MLAGRHHAELNPTNEADPEDSLALLVQKARVATLERQLLVAELALELVVPARVMELATERPLLPLDDPVTCFVGTVAYGLRGLTVMDLFQPWALYPKAAAAAERGVAQHEAVVEETERWAAQEDLEDLVYDRSKTIHTTLQALLGEAQKAGGPDGMDLATIEAQRKPMQEIVESIDRELRRLRGDPGRREMVDLLEELRAKMFDIAESIIALRDLEKQPPTRGRAAEIARHAKIVGLLVRLVELHLKGRMYEQLLLELDAYQQAARVRSAWGGAPATP